jgi:predicted small lipoprotein YifL
MKPPRQTLRAAIVGAALIAALAACQKQEGPLEQAGKQVDQAVDKAGQQIEKTADEIQDATRRDKK